MSRHEKGGLRRRDFLQMVAATMAAAGLSACHPLSRKILAYTRRPEGLIPGVPLHFATSYDLDGIASGLLVESHEGRPTKIEGNPDHPANLGAACAWEQAATLGLYDPDRAQLIKRHGLPASREALFAALDPTNFGDGARLALLLAPSSSPLQAELRAALLRLYPKARFASWSTLSRDHEWAGANLAFGRPLATRLRIANADTIVALDSDFLEGGGESLRHAREFAARRVTENGNKPNRFYAIEARPSVTGSSADHRLRLRSSEIEGFARALLHELSALGITALDSLTNEANPLTGYDRQFISAVARDLIVSGPRSLIITGPRQPPVVHAIAHAIHDALGAANTTFTLATPVVDDTAAGPDSLRALVEDMTRGAIDTLIITAWNPVYSAPADIDFAGALSHVPHSVYLATHEDETASHAEWIVPAAHFLESWGDTRTQSNVAALQQPLIAPLFSGLCAAELLSHLLPEDELDSAGSSPTEIALAATNQPFPTHGESPLSTTELRAQPEDSAIQIPTENTAAWQLLRATWEARVPEDFQSKWESALQRGVVKETNPPAPESAPVLLTASIKAALKSTTTLPSGLEIGFYLDRKVLDGRFANNPWLQELPDAISSLCWDNALELSPSTAARLKIATGDSIDISWMGRTLRAAALIIPGHADEAASITLGWGRRGSEANAAGTGFNANAIRESSHPWFGVGATLQNSGERYPLSLQQEHHQIGDRTLAVTTTLSELKKHPDFLTHDKEPPETLYAQRPYPDHRWGMAIDLSRCTGCSACVVACQSENNIPWVGKDEVKRGRAMHWLRIDRYAKSDKDDARRVPMPLMCVHCENAPCEYVCPVNATVHSDEGLNEMVYNRCVGTRYCSNNCPYKVRRFNFLDWHPDNVMLPVLRMAQNPEVTVRARGVMEKCSYCVQRIEAERIDSRVAGRDMGPIRTACQQTCPTEAIVFGDLNDPKARVSQLRESPRSYLLLNDLNTRPRTAHMARVINPNSALPEND